MYTSGLKCLFGLATSPEWGCTIASAATTNSAARMITLEKIRIWLKLYIFLTKPNGPSIVNKMKIMIWVSFHSTTSYSWLYAN